ncbi:phosphatidylserine decarboxylase [Labrys sp. LIt4]|uniref:Phosphatidylserine decarboxylase proenzyme n=1 Tax=Labrys okinawensis TaxID=346911 RepID=A0A2S9QAT8_9HYPH|nr:MULTISPECIES: phosphatidylserine decarboxylase [Labrys]MBP0578728.1 phosphatidylserine decarboxylase [Labrys sp. LIt4]PRH86461.1 phosphatidylserine decarboxylase family protein [Labrys okinawensis]
MSLAASIRKVLVPINREGYPFLGIAGVATLIALGWIKVLFWPLLILTAWVAYFFRDPQRVTPVREGLVVSPADGVVSQIANVLPPPELGLASQSLLRVSIFMNVFDCHVNRSPVTGTITKIAYKPGKFLNADLDKASEDNERNGFIIDTGAARYGVVQIAGLVARRIVCWTNENEHVAVGQRLGMIRFGSRVDVYLPEGVRPLVGIGQKMVAGETILADANTTMPNLTHRVG